MESQNAETNLNLLEKFSVEIIKVFHETMGKYLQKHLNDSERGKTF